MSDREKTISSYIANWVRWQNTGVSPVPLPPTRCGSAEKNMKSPPGALQDETPKVKLPVIVSHAERVDAIHKSLPTTTIKVIICGRYVQRAESKFAEHGVDALCEWVFLKTKEQCRRGDVEAAVVRFRQAVAKEFEL